nr:hypothetical protein [Deltaproteobacteria bacterium]
MGLLLGTRRSLLGADDSWTPASPTSGGYSPEHWYRSDSGLWQDAGVTPATADGDVVGRWEDKTANADHVNQANAAKKPTLQSGAADRLNGHPVIRFDGIDDLLVGAFTNGGAMAQPFTVFIVAQLDSSVVDDGVPAVLLDDSDPTNRVIIYKYEAPNPDAWTVYAQSVLTGNDANS